MRCPGCFQEKGSSPKCLRCGYDESQKRGGLVLPHHTRLAGERYCIGKLIGRPGGFGLTYLSWDDRLNKCVAIKEYLPRDISGRATDHKSVLPHSSDDAENFAYGLARFLDEARTLAQLDHPNIVRVQDFFEDNGTAYLVMDYYDGITLHDYLIRQPMGKLDKTQGIAILMPILDGLREVHAKGFLHRDIKPQNIYLTTGNRPILLDFGAARQAMGARSRGFTVVLSEGFAPIEQYQSNGKQGPWTDVYGAAATLYMMVTGSPPPPATDRVADDQAMDESFMNLEPRLTRALTLGLAVHPEARIASIADWQNLLVGDLVKRRHDRAPNPTDISSHRCTLTIGRSSACDITFHDRTISRRHAELYCDGNGHFQLTDLASTQGTFLRDEGGQFIEVSDQWVRPTDTVRLGAFLVTVAQLIDKYKPNPAKVKSQDDSSPLSRPCSFCGAPNGDEAVFCSHCGKPASISEQALPVERPSSVHLSRIPGVVYVGFWARAFAAFTDFLIIAFLMKIMDAFVYKGADVDVITIPCLLSIYVLAWWVGKGATPGKILISARIVDSRTGEAPGFWHYMGRFIGYILSAMPFGWGFLTIAADKRKQGWHDKLAGTAVIYINDD